MGGTGGGSEPLFYRRKDFPDSIYRTVEAKLRAIVQEIVRYHVLGRPILVGTTSVESSERLSEHLRAEPIRRLAQVMLIRNEWMRQNNRDEDGRLIPELVPLNEPIRALEAGELRRLKELGRENARLKTLVADLTLDKQVLQEVLAKKV